MAATRIVSKGRGRKLFFLRYIDMTPTKATYICSFLLTTQHMEKNSVVSFFWEFLGTFKIFWHIFSFLYPNIRRPEASLDKKASVIHFLCLDFFCLCFCFLSWSFVLFLVYMFRMDAGREESRRQMSWVPFSYNRESPRMNVESVGGAT